MSSTYCIFNVYTLKLSVRILTLKIYLAFSHVFSDDTDIGKFFLACRRQHLANLTDDADMGKFFTNFGSYLAMSVSVVSLFPDDADIAKTYLLMIQPALNRTQILREFHWYIG
jgi:hypothetical protein